MLYCLKNILLTMDIKLLSSEYLFPVPASSLACCGEDPKALGPGPAFPEPRELGGRELRKLGDGGVPRLGFLSLKKVHGEKKV